MPNRTTPAGLQIPNTPAPAGFANGVAGGWIGYAILTADQTVAGTEISLTGSVLTVPVNTNRIIRLSFVGAYAMSSGAGNRAVFRLKEGATELQVAAFGADTNGSESATLSVILIGPTQGNHTYSVTLQSPDAGTAVFKASATNPGIFLVEDIGPK